MSARRITSPSAVNHFAVHAPPTRLSLSENSVIIHKNGIEFRSESPFSAWTEMTLTLQSPDGFKLHCSGVVIACTGNKHTGYHVSMVFTGLSKQAEARLSSLAHSQRL